MNTSKATKFVAIAGLVSVALLGGAYAVTLHDREQQTALTKQQAAELQKLKEAEKEAAITAALARHIEENPELMAEVETEATTVGRVDVNAVMAEEADRLARMEERRKKIMAANEPGPINADYCVMPSSAVVFGRDEIACTLTSFQSVEEVYLARWKVAHVVTIPAGSYVFIERAVPPKG